MKRNLYASHHWFRIVVNVVGARIAYKMHIDILSTITLRIHDSVNHGYSSGQNNVYGQWIYIRIQNDSSQEYWEIISWNALSVDESKFEIISQK